MQNDIVMIPVRKHFDADGKPSCDGCAFLRYLWQHEGFPWEFRCGHPGTTLAKGGEGGFDFFDAPKGITLTPHLMCVIHNPQEPKEAL